MASRRVEENRIAYKRYKEDVKRDGKPFYPYAMFHDTVMSLVVVIVIAGLACIWYFTAEDVGPGASKPGWLGVLYEDKADPGTTSFTPRPDWYFYFLFYLLRIFKWPDTLSRFYSIHMLLLPGAIIGLITLHLYLVIRLGVSSPPWSPIAAGRDRPGDVAATNGRAGLVRPGRRGGSADG